MAQTLIVGNTYYLKGATALFVYKGKSQDECDELYEFAEEGDDENWFFISEDDLRLRLITFTGYIKKL